MPLIADRFLVEEDDVVDLATGETVRLSIDAAARATRDRAELCDRLFAVRHPLLLPLIDYGAWAGGWFEAHADLPPIRTPGIDARTSALHLVRFLRACGIDLDAAAASRNVRPAIDARPGSQRPIGIRLQQRSALDAVRTVLESEGPPGVTAITVHGTFGAGLRTARVCLARAARLAGYMVVDARFSVFDGIAAPGRHLCAIDWMPGASALPPMLALAAARGARRHAWIRFCRQPVSGAGAIGLEPVMTRELTHAIYLDPECGPTAADVHRAFDEADGLPGPAIDVLSNVRTLRGGAHWVHETAPEYEVRSRVVAAVSRIPSGGIARLERAVDAALALASRGRHQRAARVLTRCSAALATRGATGAAAAAACALGELQLDRGHPAAALDAFQRAQSYAAGRVTGARALIGSGRALLDLGRLTDAEAAFRTAAVGDPPPGSPARRWLAETLVLRGRVEAAEEALGDADPALLSTIARLQGDLSGAARAAARAILPEGQEPESVCAAHLAMAHVQAAMGALEGVRRHGSAAQEAARRGRSPALRLRAAAEVVACLEQCGVKDPVSRERLQRAARRLPALPAARIRTALGMPTTADTSLLGGATGPGDLIHQFRSLLDAIHESPDESAALHAIVADLHASLDACSVIIRSAVLRRPVAGIGRTWAGEETFTRPVLDGSGTMLRDGVTPEAAEPIAAGGSILGVVAVRWVTGARPPVPRVRDVLRTAAVAAAPMLRALHVPARPPASSEFPDDLLGPGPAAERVRAEIRRAAVAPYPVLIEGESGSGKELVARAIHARSARRPRKFCAVNCAALTDDLLEAELFGHAKGAFTGAVSERPGLFEEADQGTIFLDEAAELTARAQAKLLRVLQEGEIRRVGENMSRRIDTRVVAATNRPLDAEVRSGRFRADLRFRLDVIRIAIPPLRERPDDVPWLVERIWSEAAARVGTRATLGSDVIGALARYDWPGNVRELQNVIAALAVHGPRRGRVPAAVLPVHIAGATIPVTGIEEARKEFERRFVRAALARAGGRRSRAAAQLGVSRQGLAKIIQRLGIIEPV